MEERCIFCYILKMKGASKNFTLNNRGGRKLQFSAHLTNIFAVFSLFLILAFFVSCTKSESQKYLAISDFAYSFTIHTDYATAFRADVYEPRSTAADNAESSESVSSKANKSESRRFQAERSLILLTILDTDRYLLVPENCFVPQNLPSEINIIHLPLQNVYLAATSVMSFFSALDSLDFVGFSSLQKKDWYIDDAISAMENGSIRYAGKYNAPDFELLVQEKCPLAIESTMIYHTPQIKEKLESLGITVFVDKSSYEEHPLGRLEWIKLYGLLTGKYDEAESFFAKQSELLSFQPTEGENLSFAFAFGNAPKRSGVEKSKSPRDLPSSSEKNDFVRKTVAFFYITPAGMCIIRGSDDYIAKMIEIAGGTYIAPSKKTKTKNPSIPISFEQFYVSCADADILIYNSSIDNTLFSKKELLEKSPLFSQFKAYKTGEIYKTGKSLYQSTDKIGEVILDFQTIIVGNERKLHFLEKVGE